jgi:hypothetical protein
MQALWSVAPKVTQRTYGRVPNHCKANIRQSTFIFMTIHATDLYSDRKTLNVEVQLCEPNPEIHHH